MDLRLDLLSLEGGYTFIEVILGNGTENGNYYLGLRI